MLSRIRIIEVDVFSSKAVIVERKGKIVKNGAAFEISPVYGNLQLVVQLGSEVTETIKRKIQGVSKALDLIKLVASKESYDLKVRLERKFLVLEKPDGFVLKKMNANENNLQFKLQKTLEKETRYENFFSLTNNSNLSVQLELKR